MDQPCEHDLMEETAAASPLLVSAEDVFDEFENMEAEDFAAEEAFSYEIHGFDVRGEASLLAEGSAAVGFEIDIGDDFAEDYGYAYPLEAIEEAVADAVEALVDLAQTKDVMDAAAPELACLTICGAAPPATGLPATTRHQMAQATSRAAQRLAIQQGRHAEARISAYRMSPAGHDCRGITPTFAACSGQPRPRSRRKVAGVWRYT